MKRKILSLCCVLILLISMATPLAHAEGEIGTTPTVSYPDMVFSVDSMEMNEGAKSVVFTVSVTNNGGMCGGCIYLYFDSSAFTVDRVARGSFTNNGSFTSNRENFNAGLTDRLMIVYYKTSGVDTNDGTFCKITMTVKSENVAGTYPVHLEYDSDKTFIENDSGNTATMFSPILDVQCADGTITVNHVWDAGVKVPSLTIPDPAVQDTLYTCTVCGETHRELGYDPHHWEVTEHVDPTCTTDGHNSYKCSDCDLTRTEVLPALGHTWANSVSVDATKHTHTCSRCGYSETVDHTFVVREYAPTCTDAGYTQHTCTECGYFFRDPGDPALGHDFETRTVAPTCVDNGYTRHLCKRCGYIFDDPGAPATGHNYGPWTIIQRPINGVMTRDPEQHQKRCSVCKNAIYAPHTLVETEVAPTCTEAGYKQISCTECNYVAKGDETAPALGHNYVETVTPPTCTQAGKITYTCTLCGNSYTTAGEPATGHIYGEWVSVNGTYHQHRCIYCDISQTAQHNLEVTAETPATINHEGSRTYTCPDCGYTYTEVVPYHIFEAQLTEPPTCTEEGYTLYKCVVEGHHDYYRDYVPALGHNVETWTDNGENHVGTCTRCEAQITGEHNYSSDVIPATCTQPGSSGNRCLDCGHGENIVIPALGHDYVASASTATCTQGGVTTYTCSRCGDTYTEQSGPALGHDFGPWTSSNATTHSRTCSRCGATETANHNISTVTTPATCTEAGRVSNVCSDCGYTTTETIPALGHDYRAVVTAPTCTEAGYTTYTCSRCGNSYTEAGAPATGHNFGQWIDNGTNHIRRCSKCDASESQAHDYESVTTPPTCTEPGQIGQTCKVCGHKDTVPGDPALGHDYKAVVTAPTCTADGYTTYTCSRCGNSYTEAGPAALGHDFGPWVSVNDTTHRHDCSRCNYTESASHNFNDVTTQPTCTEAGRIVSTCSDCGYSKTEAIPALGHDYKAVVTEPTCTAAGYTTYTCSRCGNSYTEAGAPATGHSFGEWTDNGANHTRRCSKCNEIETAAHDYEITTTPPTCTEAGIVTHTCKVCGHVENSAGDPALGHDYKAVVTEPTCTAAGYTTFTCSRCGEHYTEAGAPALGHDFGPWRSVDANTHRHDCSRCNYTESASHNLATSTTQPTCTETGSKVTTCSVCGYSDTETIPALGHDYKAVVTAPTCTAAGYTTHTCSRCGDSYVDTEVPALGHSFANWRDNGDNHIRYCSRCNFSETAEHDYETVTTPPTCTEAGVVTKTCKVCSHKDVSAGEPALGHDYKAVVTEPTCTAAGYTTFTCSRCGEHYTEAGAPATGHSFGAWTSDNANTHSRTCSKCGEKETYDHSLTTATTQPTCTETGSKVTSCSVCGYSNTETIPALGHDYKDAVTAPTCTAAGYTTHTCSRCGDSYVDTEVPALGHDFGAWTDNGDNHIRRCSRCSAAETADHDYETVTTDPTCTAAGVVTKTCKVCGHKDVSAGAPALGHDYKAVVTEPTCTAAGYTTFTCSRCGNSYTEAGAPATGHSYGDWSSDNADTHSRICSKCGDKETKAHTLTTATNQPTCTEAGSKVTSCSVCGYSNTEAIPALGHDYKDVVTAPTCTAAGYTTHTCSRCGNSYTDTEVPALGHSFGDWTDNGENHIHTCSRCGASETAAHSFETVTTRPTCTADGVITKTCRVCGRVDTAPGDPATGHSFGPWTSDNGSTHSRKCANCDEKETAEHTLTVETTDPTCTASGSRTSSCAICGYSNTETIPALGHDYKAAVTAPTCTDAGYTTHTCSRCGDSYRDTEVPALGHNFGDWTDNGENHIHTCSRCGAAETAAHSFTEATTNPTCTEDGKTVSICSGCGKTVTVTIPKLGHDYTSVVTAPTCTEAGYTTFTCSRCGDSYTEAGAPATGHTFGAWESVNNETHARHCANCDETQTGAHEFTVTEVPPTETENGTRTSRCTVCGYTKTETIPATGHHYVSVETPPTCTADGYITFTCSDCGDSYVNPGAPALGHNWGAWTDNGDNHIRTCSRCNEKETAAHSFTEATTNPTCTEAGSKVSTCSVCGKVVTEAIPALGHDYKDTVTAPTCTTAGYTTHTCSRCGDSYKDSEVPALGHSFGAWTDNGENHVRTCSVCGEKETAAHSFTEKVTDPTCTEAGSKVSTCSVCGKVVTEAIPALGHDYRDTVTAPTCTAAGYTTHTCSRCGNSYRDSEVPALGHNFGAWTDNGNNHTRACSRCDTVESGEHRFTVTETAPTCTEAGRNVSTCDLCGHTDTETVPALGHDYVAAVTAPTCTTAGYTTFTCSRCGSSYTEAGAPATGHSFGEWTSVNNETHIRHCANCDVSETAEHSFNVVEIQPTDTENGSRTSTCTVCGHVITEILPAKGHNYVPVETPPTCTADGYITYTCSDCGDSYVNPGAPALGHNWGAWTDNGDNHIRTCSRCGQSETAEHSLTETVTDPTCTEAGRKSTICSICGKTVTETIPALGHDYKDTVTAPTCTAAGYTTHTCSRCGDSYRDSEVPALGHNWGAWSDNGENHIRTCSRCGDKETAAHVFNVTETNPTCTEAGSKVSTCSVCGHTDTETIPALGHDYKSVETAPTCTAAGYTTYTCSRCGNTYTVPGAAATGHSFGNWESLNNASHIRRCANCDATETADHDFTVTEVPATPDTSGTRTYTCKDCGYVKTETIPPLGHNYVAVETAPTCTADGYITYTCTDCGDSYTNPGAPALGHNWSAWTDNGDNHIRTCSRCNETEAAAHSFNVSETAPTCTEAGSKVSTCSVCGKTVTEAIPALGHDYKAVETAPTCTTAGYTTYTCARCGNTYTEPGAPAAGHSFGNWESLNNASHIRRCANCDVTETADHDFTVTEVPATPDASGTKTYTCKDCGYVKTETIPPLGHNYVAVETPPTCTEDGYITYTCTDCGDSYTNPGAPALGHNWSAWTDNGDNHIRTCSRCNETETAEHSFNVSETAPTCVDAGSKVSTCSVCGKTVTEAIPALGHNYVETVIAPTETAGGYTLHECTRCGDSYMDNYTDPITPPITELKGDIDRDGDVDNADLIMVARYIVHLVEFNDYQMRVGDFNDDGVINNKDLILIARRIVSA